MPSVRPGLIVQVPARTYNRGSSDTAAQRAAFPGSPIYDGTYSSDDQVRNIFRNPRELVVGVFNDGGYAFGTTPRYYQDSPDLTTVRVGGAGLPGSPYAPNIASATDINNPTTIPASGVEATNRERGSGGAFQGNGLTSPSTTTAQITSRRLGDPLELGRRTRI